MSNWLVDKLIPSIMRSEVKKSSVPEGLWHKCPSCDAVLYRPELEKTLDVCPKCNHHMRIGARARIDIFLDADGRAELGADLEPVDRLKFRDSKKYKDRLVGAQKQTGEKDALISMSGTLLGMPVVVSAFEFSFMGGSMGAIVGERFVRAVESGQLRYDDPDTLLTGDMAYTVRRSTAHGWVATRASDERPTTASLAAIRAVWLATTPAVKKPQVY